MKLVKPKPKAGGAELCDGQQQIIKPSRKAKAVASIASGEEGPGIEHEHWSQVGHKQKISECMFPCHQGFNRRSNEQDNRGRQQ